MEVVSLPEQRQCNPLPPPFGTGFNPLTNYPSFAGCGADPNRTIGVFPAPIYAATGFDLEQRPAPPASNYNPFNYPNGFERPETAHVPRHVATGSVLQPHRIFLNSAARQENIFWGWTSTLSWEAPTLPLLGDSQIKNITAFQRTHPDGFQDPDGTDLDLFAGGTERKTNQWSSELQWSGATLNERVEWLGSLFYLHEETDNLSEFTVKLSGTQRLTIDQLAENKSYGASLSTTWHALDNFSIRLGGRYIKDVKRNRLLRDNPPVSSNANNAALGVCDGAAEDTKGLIRGGNEFGDGFPDDGLPTCKQSFRQVIGELTLNWWPREQNNLYFTVGNGYKGGGFALGESGSRNQSETSLATYEPEKIWAFMLGSKNSFFDERLTLNLEAWYYNYRDQQLVLIDGFAVRTDNAKDTLMQGLDLEFDSEPIPGLRFDGTVSVMDTEFKDYRAVDPLDVLPSANCRQEASSLDPTFRATSPGCILSDFSGNEVTRSPKLSYNLGAEYDIYLGRFGTVTPRVQFYFQDETWFRPQNRTFRNSGDNTPCPVALPLGGCTITQSTPPSQRDGPNFLLNGALGNDEQEQYHYTDIKLTWRSPSENWTVEAFVQNLEDNVVFQNVLVSTPLLDSPQMAWYGHPRIWGIRVGFRY